MPQKTEVNTRTQCQAAKHTGWYTEVGVMRNQACRRGHQTQHENGQRTDDEDCFRLFANFERGCQGLVRITDLSSLIKNRVTKWLKGR